MSDGPKDFAKIMNTMPDTGHRESVPRSIDPEQFKLVVNARRSVRVYDGTPVPDAVVHACIDLALLAPNSSNLQPWQFIRVRTPEIKKELARLCMGQPAATTAAELIVCVARTGTWRQNAQQMLQVFDQAPKPVPKGARLYYEKLAPMAYSQGPLGVLGLLKKIAVFFIGLRKVIPREPTSRAQMVTWAHKSTALACENLMLAFSAHGYDSCPMEGFDSVRVRKLLKLPRDASVCMIVSAGKRAPQGIYGPRIRFPREQFVTEI